MKVSMAAVTAADCAAVPVKAPLTISMAFASRVASENAGSCASSVCRTVNAGLAVAGGFVVLKIPPCTACMALCTLVRTVVSCASVWPAEVGALLST